MKCASCAAKSGSPVLCEACLHNRRTIDELQRGSLLSTVKELLQLFLPKPSYYDALHNPKASDSMKWDRLKIPTVGDLRRWLTNYELANDDPPNRELWKG